MNNSNKPQDDALMSRLHLVACQAMNTDLDDIEQLESDCYEEVMDWHQKQSQKEQVALLRGLLEHKDVYEEDITKLAGYPESQWHEAVPASVIETKLRELEAPNE